MAVHLITVSVLILAVLLVRAVFRKKVPARLIYALWLVVAVKLCMPFSLFAVELPSASEASQTEQTVVQTQDVPSVTKASEATILAPITLITPIASQQPVASQEIGTKPSEPIAPTVTKPAIIEPIETEVVAPGAPTVVETTPIDWAHIAKVVWFVGSAVMAVWFAVTGAVFHQRLCADRRLHTTVGRTKVYVSKSAGAPCLAGIVPAIYLTPDAANSPSEHFVITHEYTHLRHGDHIWSTLRTVALIVYWWNPLVWAAAMVSKQDAELACDEAVAAKLDDSQRLAYAHTILDTIPQKHAHAVGLGSAPIKERILMLTKRHKNRVVAAILAVALTLCAVGCSFIGPKETTEPVDDTPDLPGNITTAQTTDVPPEVTTAADVQNTPVAAESPVRVLSNAGNLDIYTVLLPLENADTRYTSFVYNERYTIYLTYERLRNENQGYEQHADALYIVDALDGKIAAAYALDVQARPNTVSYTDNGCILYDCENIGDGQYRVNCAFAITERNGTFSVTAMQTEPFPQAENRFVSADGKYTVYETSEDGWGNGGIDVQSPDGSVKRILTNVMLGDTDACKAKDIGDVIGYVPIGFMDEVHFAYWIGGWEWMIGYGIYNAATGEGIETNGTYYPAGIYDGAFFVVEHEPNGDGTTSPCAIWQVTPDGERTKIAPSDGNASLAIIAETGYPTFEHSMWYTIETEDVCKVTLHSPDFDSQELAEIECPHVTQYFMKQCLLICQSSVTVVVPHVSAKEDVYAETPTADTEFYTSVETVGSTYYTDLTGDGVAEICIVKVPTRGANSYIEDIVITDGQSGETIAVVDPQFFTDHNSLLNVGGDADTVEVDYTVRDGVLMCRMRRSGIVGDDTKSWTLSYTYSYVAGEFAITGACLRDDMTDAVTDFGTLEPMPSLPAAPVSYSVPSDKDIQGEWYYNCSYESGYSLEFSPAKQQMQWNYFYYESEYVNRYTGSYSVDENGVFTADLHDSGMLHTDPDITITFAVETCDTGIALTYVSVSVEKYQHLVGQRIEYIREKRRPTVYTTEKGTMITSLADWKELNYDSADCYAFINSFVHFGGKADLAEQYPQIAALQIDSYTISRTADGDRLYFNFTVTQSELETLPCGYYQTTVREGVVVFFEILSCDAQERVTEIQTDRASAKIVKAWIGNERTWDLCDYGTYSDRLPTQYLLERYYGNSMPIEELIPIIRDKCGVEVTPEQIVELGIPVTTIDGKECVILLGLGGFVAYDIVELVTDGDVDTVTVQYYNDVNKLIPSIKVEYRIDSEERPLDCTLVEDSVYEPLGMQAGYKYKGWEPMQ